jgi:hypothetical protein
MLASKAMIYLGCTMGLEVEILGIPTLSLMLGDNPWHSSAISNVVNATAQTVEEALDYSDYLVLDPERISAHRVPDALAILYGKLTLVATANPSMIEASRDTSLQDW